MGKEFLIGIGMDDIENEIIIHKIRYIRSDRNYCEIHLQGGEMRLLRSPIYRLEQQLAGKGFFRIHKSYLVNQCWIDKVADGRVICGKDILPVAVRKKTEFRQWYQRLSLK